MSRSRAVMSPEVSPHHTHFERMLTGERVGCVVGLETKAYLYVVEGICVTFSSFVYLFFVCISSGRHFKVGSLRNLLHSEPFLMMLPD